VTYALIVEGKEDAEVDQIDRMLDEPVHTRRAMTPAVEDLLRQMPMLGPPPRVG
jgi:hypothetical protein